MRELPYYPMPMPAQMVWSLETTGDVQEHATNASLCKSEFHDCCPLERDFATSSPWAFVFLKSFTRIGRRMGNALTFGEGP